MRRFIMTLQKRMFMGVLLAASLLPACGDWDEIEHVGVGKGGIGGTADNNVSPQAIDAAPLARAITNGYSITTPGNADPLPLCQGGTITGTGCTMKQEWQSWLTDPNVDLAARDWMMKGIVKCSVESTFTIQTEGGPQTFPGQVGLYPGWKSNRLTGANKRERVSSCILSLLNGNNQSLEICIIGPGGSPFIDPCTDPNITNREGGFFGDLFATNPTAYVAGPDADQLAINGRICSGTQGSYCCAESDANCPHKIVLAGAILGSPDQSFENKRCNSLATSGSYEYCTSFFSTREPGRNYTNVFTTFVPPLP
jgi:hypothetical protein